MSWAYGTNNSGREIGYGVETICDEINCETKIDCGLAYVCGDMHDGGEHGCGKYFCYEHLLMGKGPQLCRKCFDSCNLPFIFEALEEIEER